MTDANNNNINPCDSLVHCLWTLVGNGFSNGQGITSLWSAE